MDTTIISAAVTILALGFYVLLDGFDLGVGALMATASDQGLRDRLAESIEPTWDGNETWLIMAGVALLAAFPVAYAILLPALYVPLILMLLSLGFRAVAFDFRRQESPMQGFWDRAFAAGSIGAALTQGLVLGAVIQGVEVEGDHFAGSPLDALTPFTFLTAVTVLGGYSLLGAGWARWRLLKADRSFIDARLRQLLVVAGLLGAATIAVSFLVQPALAARASALWPLTAASIAGIALAIGGIWSSSRGEADMRPFLWALLGAAAALLGLVAVLLPDIVPFRVDLWKAASAPASQTFFLIGAAIVIPMILGYTAFAYWVFRGKVADAANPRVEAAS
jgi:cytochrome d ubiquinol oxidase subunit II